MPSPRFQPQPLVKAIREGDLRGALEGISRGLRPQALVVASGALLGSSLPAGDRVVVLERLLVAGLNPNACPSVPAKGSSQDTPPSALARSLLAWPGGLVERPRDWGAPLLARAWLDANELIAPLLAAGATPVYGGRQGWFSALAAVASTLTDSTPGGWTHWKGDASERWTPQAWWGVLAQWVLAPEIDKRPLSAATMKMFFHACAQHGPLPEPSGRDLGRLWHALRFQNQPVESWRRVGGWLLTLSDEALVRLQTSCLDQEQQHTLYEPALHLALQGEVRLLDRLRLACPGSPAGRVHPSTGVFPGEASLPTHAPQWLDAASWMLHGLAWPAPEEGVLERADQVWAKLLPGALDRTVSTLPQTVWTHGELWGGTSGRHGAPEAWWDRHRSLLAPHPRTGRNAFHRAVSVERMQSAHRLGVDLAACDAEGNQAFVCLVVNALADTRPRAQAWCAQRMEHLQAPLEGAAWGRPLSSWVDAHPTLKRVYKIACKAVQGVPASRTVPADAVQVACFHLDAPRLKKLLARAPDRLRALTFVDQKGQTPMGALCQAPVGRGMDQDKMARVLELLDPAPLHVPGQAMHPVVALLHRNVSGNDTVLPDKGWESVFAKAGREKWPSGINRMELADALASWWRRNRAPSSGSRNASAQKFAHILGLLQLPKDLGAEVVMRVLEQDVERQPTAPHQYRREADRLDEQETAWLFEAFEAAMCPINPGLFDGQRLRLAIAKTAPGCAATPEMFEHPLLQPALREQALGESWSSPHGEPETKGRRRF